MPTTPTESSGHERLAQRRRYRRLFWACFALALGGFFAGNSLGYPLTGLAVYWGGVLGMLAIWKGAPIEVFDERERTLERRASQVTISLFGLVLIVAGPGQALVAELGYELPAWYSTAMWAYASVFVVWAVAYLVVRYRP